ncbi:TRAP transporter small permease [Thalassobacillus pellis]|uniref:TRAP transporter small permease n=1 Tax=Thalassobacillus pellis TaxID=748008 RepID=UPI001960D84A|nr:TRAP transporter small permease [Thalassobacillus pellis]MBM7551613.1 TRAP-type C4-dicarboxylate transport system permease small subunit [Thalassobacillus pellis]
MLNKVGKALHHTLSVAIFICLATMFVLVFANVVLRYAFNSGITWSSEMSRYLFVWLVFLGAIAALKDNMHLNMDLVTSILPPKAKKVFFVISNLLVLCTLGLFLKGSWSMTLLTMQRLSPATNIPLGYVYGVGIIASIAMGGIVLVRLVRTLVKGEKEGSLAAEQQEQTDYKFEKIN